MVRCADCGFLTTRNSDTRAFDEVDYEARKTGNFPSCRVGSMLLVCPGPFCFRMVADFRAECSEVKEKDGNKGPDGEPNAMKIHLAVITKDRDCQEFTEWHPGFSPKEHREMLFDLERKKLDLQEKAAERRFQLINTYASIFVGAVLSLIVGVAVAYWTGKNDSKPTPAVQPTQPEKKAENP